MTWDEIDFGKAVWRVPASRMKMQKPHDVPLSDPALAILRTQEIGRGDNPHMFPGRPMRPLSTMAMRVLLKRLGVGATVHGFRASFRMWAAEVAHAPFEIAEVRLAHQVGNAVVHAYQRSSMLERRRPIMSAWAAFLSGGADSNVVSIKRGVA